MIVTESSPTVYNWNKESIEVSVPLRPLKAGALQVSTTDSKKLADWTKEDHVASLECMQKIARVWKKQEINQHLIFGKVEEGKTFSWQIAPYQKPAPILFSPYLGRVWQQITVLWRITFGAPELRDPDRCAIAEAERAKFEADTSLALEPVLDPEKGSDAFCKYEVIEKQWVLKGKEVTLLYNYAPIGLGGERLHFLAVSNKHRARVVDFTTSEYAEAMELEQKAIEKLSKTRTITAVYKHTTAGPDAGQSVDHGHLHSIVVTNLAQDFFGKCTVLWKMVFGSSPLPAAELQAKVEALRIELNS